MTSLKDLKRIIDECKRNLFYNPQNVYYMEVSPDMVLKLIAQIEKLSEALDRTLCVIDRQKAEAIAIAALADFRKDFQDG